MTGFASLHRFAVTAAMTSALAFGLAAAPAPADAAPRDNHGSHHDKKGGKKNHPKPVSGTYTIDPWHTMVLAQWNHFEFSNPTANFADVTGTIQYDARRPERSSVDVTIPISGLHGFSDAFDHHLRAPDLFDIAQFPQATFKSTRVKQLGRDRFWVRGNLTIKGITKSVDLDVTLNHGGVHGMTQQPAIGFDAYTTIKRSDFGLGLAVPLVSDKVRLRITTEAQIGPSH